MSDLIRSHEGNADTNSSDSTKVHWGKFNMMGRFISNTTQCQAQCRNSTDYNFPERPHMKELIMVSCLMDEEASFSKITQSYYIYIFSDANITNRPAGR